VIFADIRFIAMNTFANVNKIIRIHPKDDMLVALSDLSPGEKVSEGDVVYEIKETVLAKHKFATRDFAVNDPLHLYGIVIGKATRPISTGSLISTLNTKHDAEPFSVRPGTRHWTPPDVGKWSSRKFQGYHRADGQVGTRNYWVVIPLVFCENRNVDYIKNAFSKKLGYAVPDKYEALVDELITAYRTNQPLKITSTKATQREHERIFHNIDGIKFLTHNGGCGGTQQDAQALSQLIAGYIHNPNVAGATILSLGCQHLQIAQLEASIRSVSPEAAKPVLFFEQQKYPGEENLLSEAIIHTFSALVKADEIERKEASLDKLCIGLKCGGSDGFSGITANPAMGQVSDILSALSGRTILAEFPELCGVEQELIDRSVSMKVAEKFARLMTNYNDEAEAVGSGFSMNPSPGNIKDGLITDAMKSAGAAKKGGTAPVSDVLDYAEYISKPGLNLLCTPGNDVEATTGMAGSGANLIIFSTGLGTPTGNAIAPVIKTSTNSKLAQKLPDLIDFDHGDIISGNKTIEQSADELMEFIIEVASGREITKSERLHQDDFIPWKRGVSL
jgi:altronate hydrolase